MDEATIDLWLSQAQQDDVISPGFRPEVQRRMLKQQAEIERLKDTEKRLIEHLDAKTGDCVQDEMWDDVWHLAHPGDSSWEYPGQVIREVRAEIVRLREALKQIATPLKFVNEDLLGDPYYYRKLALDALKEVTDE